MPPKTLEVGLQWCKDCERLNKAIDIMNRFDWQYIGTTAYDREHQEILLVEEDLMNIMQIVNPAQQVRKIRLISREEFMTRKAYKFQQEG